MSYAIIPEHLFANLYTVAYRATQIKPDDSLQAVTYKTSWGKSVEQSRKEVRYMSDLPTYSVEYTKDGTQYLSRVLADENTPTGEEVFVVDIKLHEQIQLGLVSRDEFDSRVTYFATVNELVRCTDKELWDRIEEGDLIS